MSTSSLACAGRIVVFTVTGVLYFSGTAVSAGFKAEIRNNPPNKDYKYGILLSGFKTPLPEREVGEITIYTVKGVLSGEPIELKEAKYAGVSEVDERTKENVYYGAWLYGDFDPEQDYEVTVTYGEYKTESDVTKAPAREGRGQDGDTVVSADVTFPDNNNGSRLKIASTYYFNDLYFGKKYWANWRLFLSLDGDVTTKSPAPDMQNIVDAVVKSQFRVVYHLPVVIIGDGVRDYAYSSGLEVGFPAAEMNQSLSSVNFKTQVRTVSTVPVLLDSVLLSWLKAVGANKAFVPPAAYFGYAYVSPERNAASLTSESGSPYWRREWGVKWSFPLHSSITGFVSYERARPEREKVDKANFDAALRFYVDNGKRYAVNADYQKGSLPPTYKETEKFAVGVYFDPLKPTK